MIPLCQYSCRSLRLPRNHWRTQVGLHHFSGQGGPTSSEAVTVEKTKSKRRRRRGLGLADSANIPSYKEFVHRFTVLSLYRRYLKEIRLMPHNQGDLKEQVQKEFKAHKELSDPFNVQRSLAEGKRRFEELQEFTGSNNKYDGDSWLNTVDPEDSRGRVGTGWPWNRPD